MEEVWAKPHRVAGVEKAQGRMFFYILKSQEFLNRKEDRFVLCAVLKDGREQWGEYHAINYPPHKYLPRTHLM